MHDHDDMIYVNEVKCIRIITVRNMGFMGFMNVAIVSR